MFCLCSLLGTLWYHVLYLSLKAIWLIFVYGVRMCSLHWFMQLSSSPNTTCWRDRLFSHWMFLLLLCHNSVDRGCVGLFLGSLVSFCWAVCLFCANTTLFSLLCLGSIVRSQGAVPSTQVDLTRSCVFEVSLLSKLWICCWDVFPCPLETWTSMPCSSTPAGRAQPAHHMSTIAFSVGVSPFTLDSSTCV